MDEEDERNTADRYPNIEKIKDNEQKKGHGGKNSKKIAPYPFPCRTFYKRSEEHTSELQSQFHLLFPFFFLKDTAPPEIYPLPLHRRSSDLEKKKGHGGKNSKKIAPYPFPCRTFYK